MEKIISSLRRRVVEYRYHPVRFGKDIDSFLHIEGKQKLIQTLKKSLKKGGSIKFHVSLQVELIKYVDEEKTLIEP